MPYATPDAAYEAQLRETTDGAAAVLSAALGRPRRLEIDRNFRGPRSRSTVLRFHDADGGPYDPNDIAVHGPRGRLLNEWAGARFLAGVAGERPFGPAVYGGDGRLGLVVLEDLGEGECLADLLQAGDAARAEAALVAYAATLGQMHAATLGQQGRYATPPP